MAVLHATDAQKAESLDTRQIHIVNIDTVLI
jgi:hypothetical protein